MSGPLLPLVMLLKTGLTNRDKCSQFTKRQEFNFSDACCQVPLFELLVFFLGVKLLWFIFHSLFRQIDRSRNKKSPIGSFLYLTLLLLFFYLLSRHYVSRTANLVSAARPSARHYIPKRLGLTRFLHHICAASANTVLVLWTSAQ